MNEIHKLAINSITILLLINQLEGALYLIKKCEKISELFNFDLLKANLNILKVSLHIRKNVWTEEKLEVMMDLL